MKNQELLNLLANYYAIYIKTHCYHWNITGENFISLHKMLEDQYNKLAQEIDEIAECIRMLGEKVPVSLSKMASLAKISDPNENLSSSFMLKDLYDSNINLLEMITKVFQSYLESSNLLVQDLIAKLVVSRKKEIWFLESSLSK